MQSTDHITLLEAAPEQHGRRCAFVKSAIDTKRWPAATSGLRLAASLANDWARQANEWADWCEAQGATGQAPATEDNGIAAPAGTASLEALEAGVMALAHSLGRNHAACARRAMNGVITAQTQQVSA